MKGQLRIETVYAFIVLDDDGTEGIPAFYDPTTQMLMPMTGADTKRVEDLKRIIMRDPMLAGKRITLAHFTTRTDIEVIQR